MLRPQLLTVDKTHSRSKFSHLSSHDYQNIKNLIGGVYEMTVGFRILQRQNKIDLETAKKFLDLPVANVSDSMWRLTAGGSRLRPMHKSGQMAGPALTVRTRPGDNLMLHKAIDMAQIGDVIVCDAGGDLTNSMMGELMLAHAVKRGVGGFVIDGAVRDAEAFQRVNLPVFAAGISHRGPYKDGPGEINVSVAINGMVIEPGDLVIGDFDGVLAIPFHSVNSILSKTEEKQAAELEEIQKIKAGEWDRSWVDKTLLKRGREM